MLVDLVSIAFASDNSRFTGLEAASGVCEARDMY